MRGATVLCGSIVLLLCVCAVSAERYDWVIQNPSNASAPKPLPRYHHAAAAVGNTSQWVVVIGGFDFVGDGLFLNDTWVYNTRNNTWREVNHTSIFPSNHSTAANLTKRAYFSANTYRGREVIVFGGQGPSATQMHNDVWRFWDFEWHQDTYANISDTMFVRLYREYHASAIVGDTLYVFGGHSMYYGYTTNEMLAYNLTARNWTVAQSQGAPGPVGRQGHTLHYYKDAVFGDTLILFGGYSDQPYTGGFNDTWQYSLRDKKWYQLGAVGAPDGRSGHSGAIIGNTLYIQGGYSVHNIEKPPTYDTYYGDTWGLSLFGGGASKWAQLTDDTAFGLGRRQGHQMVPVNNTLYSVGGYQQYIGLDINVWAFQDV